MTHPFLRRERVDCILRLPYFDCVRFTIIDPMHNLFLGTAKNILKNIWLDNFSANNLQHIQKLVDSSEVPKSIGSWKNST